MLNWLQIMLSMLSPPGINILIGILSLFYCIRFLWFKAIFCLLFSIILLYITSIPLISNTLMFKLENKYQPFKMENISKYSNVNAIVAVLTNSYLSSDFMIMQNLLQLSKETKLPMVIIDLHDEGLYITKVDLINSYIANMIKISENSSLNLLVSVGDEKNTKDNNNKDSNAKDSKVINNNFVISPKDIQRIIEQNNIHKIFLISDDWNIEKAQQMLKKFKLEEIIPVPIISNIKPPKNNIINSFIPNGTSLLYSELAVKVYLENIVNKVKAIFSKN